MSSIIDKYQKGESVISICKHYSISRETAYKELRKHKEWGKLKDRYNKNKKNYTTGYYLDQSDKIFELAEEGVTSVHIARALKIPVKRIRSILKGSQYDKSRAKTKNREGLVRQGYSQGKNIETLAKKFNLSESWIKKIVKK